MQLADKFPTDDAAREWIESEPPIRKPSQHPPNVLVGLLAVRDQHASLGGALQKSQDVFLRMIEIAREVSGLEVSDDISTRKGLSEETINEIRRQVLGIDDAPPQA